MFNLGRPDVMPADDIGLQNAVKRHYRMRERPNKKKLLKIAERWRPYRSAAAWYLWRSLHITLPDGKAPAAPNRTTNGRAAKPSR
jgi:DNA-3-methyladenine glycosylase II